MLTLQPNALQCFVCGLANSFGLHLRFYNTEPGKVVAEYTVPEQYQGYPGVVHGGIVAAMLDETAGRSHMYNGSKDNVSSPRFMYTAKLEIRYRHNVPIGRQLRLVGTAGKSKGRMAYASAQLFDGDQLLAEADALLIDIPAETLSGVDLDSSGWKVYPRDTQEA